MRYRRVIINGALLCEIFIEGREHKIKCVKGLPEGTKFCYAIDEPVYGISMIIEHESFNLLGNTDVIPIHPAPLMEKL